MSKAARRRGRIRRPSQRPTNEATLATTRIAGAPTEASDEVLDAMIELDPLKPGRHNARFVEYGYHLWAVLNSLRRTNGDIVDAAAEWGMPADAIRAAIRYYERHRELSDAYFRSRTRRTTRTLARVRESA